MTLIVILSAASFVGQIVSDFVLVGNKYVDRIAEWIDVNHEGSIPTWYATITLMSCAAMLAVIAVDARRRRNHHTSGTSIHGDDRPGRQRRRRRRQEKNQS